MEGRARGREDRGHADAVAATKTTAAVLTPNAEATAERHASPIPRATMYRTFGPGMTINATEAAANQRVEVRRAAQSRTRAAAPTPKAGRRTPGRRS